MRYPRRPDPKSKLASLQHCDLFGARFVSLPYGKELTAAHRHYLCPF
jgi:hypothetical protein